MKKKIMKALTLGLSIACCAFALNVQAATTITENQTGTIDGYNYELWKDNGTTSMTLNGGGKFSCSWSNINNALFRTGKKYDETKTHQQLGTISLDYAANYQPSGNSYLAVYGWTSSPLVEYYIIDSWGSWRPPGATSKGTITVDGATYDVYETTRVNQPSIKGTATFEQYWSVRTSKRTSGTISVSDHFKAWESRGMTMGKMYEVSLVVEGYQSSGSANITTMNLNVGGGTQPVVKGDLNADGSINALDFAALKSHLVGATKLSGTALSNADVNGDGQVDALDFALMKKFILGLITTF